MSQKKKDSNSWLFQMWHGLIFLIKDTYNFIIVDDSDRLLSKDLDNLLSMKENRKEYERALRKGDNKVTLKSTDKENIVVHFTT